MNILNIRKNIKNFAINYIIVFSATLIVFFLGVLIFKTDPSDSFKNIVLSEGIDFGIMIYAFFAILLLFVIYIYSRFNDGLLERKKNDFFSSNIFNVRFMA